MSGPKCATVVPASVSHEVYRAAQEEARRLELARHAREQRVLAEAKSRVDALIQQQSALRKRLDDARLKLPGLSYVLEELPPFPHSDRLVAWHDYAAALEERVRAWQASAELAIEQAEYLHRRRQRTREAWARHEALRDQLDQQRDDLRELAGALGETVRDDVLSNALLTADAECEEVEKMNDALLHEIERVKEQNSRCRETVQANLSLRAVIDRLVMRHALVSSANELAKWKRSEQAARLHQFEERLQRHLHQLELSESELPTSLRSLLADIRLGHCAAEGVDFWTRSAGLVGKRRQRTQAFELMSAPPFVEDADLIEHWRCIYRELDHVANGLAELTPTLQRAYDDLQRVAKERIALRYTQLAVEMALRESGFVAVEREDIQFDDLHAEHLLLGLPGYQDHCVLMRMNGDQVHWIPFRTNDTADRGAQVRDREFDDAACSKLHRAAHELNSSGGVVIREFAGLVCPDEHPVLLASEMVELGVRVEPQAAQRPEAKQAFRGNGGN